MIKMRMRMKQQRMVTQMMRVTMMENGIAIAVNMSAS